MRRCHIVGKATDRTTSLVHQRPARSLRLLWPATKLPGTRRVPSGNAPHLADLPATAQSENATHELADVCSPANALSPPNSPYHSSLDGPCSMTHVIPGKSRVREIRTPGSVRAKAEWLSYSTNSIAEFMEWYARSHITSDEGSSLLKSSEDLRRALV